MKILVGDVEVAASSVGSILGHVAERADLCIKVLDRDGYVRAVNERGLALLQVPQDQFCGQIWADLWTDEYHAKAANAVELGLQGVNSLFPFFPRRSRLRRRKLNDGFKVNLVLFRLWVGCSATIFVVLSSRSRILSLPFRTGEFQ